MSETALSTLSDDILLRMASGSPDSVDPSAAGYSNDFLMKLAQERLNSQVDTKSGAPPQVREQVAVAMRPEDKLMTLRNFFPDAVPVEVFDPEFGAEKYGRGNFVFTNPETGQPTLFDEDLRLFGIPVPSRGDISDVGPEIFETVGGIFGGIALGAAGLPGGPPGVAAGIAVGEGLGSAAAREAYINIIKFFGEVEDNRTGLEKFGDFSTTAAINAAAGPIVSKVAQGVKFVAGAPIRYAANSLSTPAKETLERMTRAGVTDPTAGQVTGSPVANLFEQALANAPTSTRIMRENAQQTLIQLDQAVQNLAQRYGGTRTYSEAAERTMSAAQAARARYDDQVRAMYNKVGELMPPDLVSDAPAVRDFVERYLASARTATGKPELNPALRQAERVLQDAKDGVLNYDRLKEFRTSLMHTVRRAESQGALDGPQRRVKELIGYVTKDLDDLVESAGSRQMDLFDGRSGSTLGEEVLRRYKAANKFVADNARKGGDIAFIDKVIRAGEEQATGALRLVLRGTKEGGDSIEALRRKFTPEEFNVLSGFMLGRMGLPTASAQGVSEIGEAAAKEGARAISEAGFSPARFISNWNSLSKEAKEALFAGTEYQDLVPALDDLVFTIDRVGKAAADMANPSGTARALAAMGTLGVFGLDIGSAGFGYGLSGLVGPYASAKLLTNKDFVKWLANGVETAVYDPNSFGQHVRRLVQVFEVNPDIRDEVRAVLQGLTQDTIEPMPYETSASQPPLSALPEGNELKFRRKTDSTVADEVLPNREELLAQLSNIQLPQIEAPAFEGMGFEPLPVVAETAAGMGMDLAMSPTILPRAEDRELAMRTRGGGIAGLI